MTGPVPDLAALREKAEKAIPGPWIYLDYEVANENGATILDAEHEDDGVYVAAVSPDVLLAILALVDDLRAENERLQGENAGLQIENHRMWSGLDLLRVELMHELVDAHAIIDEALAGSPAENKEEA